MVGIAGKSKGCTTCRRRKIRCDQARPSCSNCMNSGRPCEGYARYPVFLNYTAQGLERRRPLEEAKSDASHSTPSPAAASAGATASSADLSIMPYPADLAASPSTQSIWTAGFLSRFWAHYSPSSGSSSPGVPPHGPLWLYLAMSIPHPTEVLQRTLLALAIVRGGRAVNDNSLVIRGQRFYSQAVRMLQRSLESREQMLHEEILAAVRAMVLYEVCLVTFHLSSQYSHHEADTLSAL
jgi:hypothetical protein